MEQAEGQEAAGTSSGGSGISQAGKSRPVGVVAPQKRGAAVAENAGGPSGTVVTAGPPSRPASNDVDAVREHQQPPVQPPNAGQEEEPTRVPNIAAPRGNRVVTADPEKLKLIQQQLLLFLHAYNCQRQQQSQPCDLPHCHTMSNVINHMSSCHAGRSCTVPHCSSSRQIVGHWRHCERADCRLCLPVREAERNWRLYRNPGDSASEFWIRLNNRLFGNVSAGADRAVGFPTAEPPIAEEAAPVLQQQNEAVAGPSTSGSQQQQPARSQPARVPRALVQTNRAWQRTVKVAYRNQLVEQMVKLLCPNLDPRIRFDKGMRNLVSFAMKIERIVYGLANSRKEYCRLFRQKLSGIQMAFSEKRKQRRQKLQQLAQGASGASNPPLNAKQNKAILKAAKLIIPKPVGAVRPTMRYLQLNGTRVPLPPLIVANVSITRERSLDRLVTRLANRATATAPPRAIAPAAPNEATPAAPSADRPRASVPPFQAADEGERQFSIQRCIQSLMHACQCRSASCQISSCQRMKRVVQHIKSCRRRTSGGCPICRQLVGLCCHHSKHCRDANCPVPFCFNIKQKLNQLHENQRLQREQSLGMDAMNAQAMEPIVQEPLQQIQQPQQPQQEQQPVMVAVGPADSSVPNAATRLVVQQLRQLLRSPNTPEQRNQIIHILGSNPRLVTAIVQQREMLRNARNE